MIQVKYNKPIPINNVTKTIKVNETNAQGTKMN